MVNPVTGIGVQKGLQFVEEATFGTLPLSSPTFTWVGGDTGINPQIDTDGQDIKIVAHEDPTAVLAGELKNTLDFTVYPQTSAILKYGINAQGGGSGTIDKSLSMLWSILISGVEMFFEASGCRIDTLKLKGQAGKPLTADVSMKFASLQYPFTTSGMTTPTYATDPGTAPWNYNSGGLANVTIGGSWLDVVSIEVDFARNLKEIWTMQQTSLQYLVPANRMITGTIKMVAESNTNLINIQNLNEQTVVWTLKSAVSTLTLNNVSFRKLSSYEIKPDDVVYETYAFEGRGATIT